MMHPNRTFCITDVTPEKREDMLSGLVENTWTLCTALRIDGLLWLNDSISENGAQEYAVCVEVSQADGSILLIQCESITVSWCDDIVATADWLRDEHGKMPLFATFKLHQHAAGEPCPLCA